MVNRVRAARPVPTSKFTAAELGQKQNSGVVCNSNWEYGLSPRIAPVQDSPTRIFACLASLGDKHLTTQALLRALSDPTGGVDPCGTPRYCGTDVHLDIRIWEEFIGTVRILYQTLAPAQNESRPGARASGDYICTWTARRIRSLVLYRPPGNNLPLPLSYLAPQAAQAVNVSTASASPTPLRV